MNPHRLSQRQPPRTRTDQAIRVLSISLLTRAFRSLASLKVAIPLLVVLTVITIAGSLFPTPDLFWSNAYLALLGILGLSLLLITIQHAPMILKRRGRNALLGVIMTHLGILVLIAGIIYGGYTGFRHEIKLTEGDVTIVPGLPFAIQLDRLVVEEYRQDEFPTMNLETLPSKRQDSHIKLLRNGNVWLETVVAPAKPLRVEGITLLPALNDIGWYFELIVTDPLGRESYVPVPPWQPPLVTLGKRQIMTHGRMTGENPEIEIFTKEGEALESLGTVRKGESLELERYQVSLGSVRRYTGMQVYNRPQEPILVLGSILMFVGLVWHFYFRHRDRRREGRGDA